MMPLPSMAAVRESRIFCTEKISGGIGVSNRGEWGAASMLCSRLPTIVIKCHAMHVAFGRNVVDPYRVDQVAAIA